MPSLNPKYSDGLKSPAWIRLFRGYGEGWWWFEWPTFSWKAALMVIRITLVVIFIGAVLWVFYGDRSLLPSRNLSGLIALGMSWISLVLTMAAVPVALWFLIKTKIAVFEFERSDDKQYTGRVYWSRTPLIMFVFSQKDSPAIGIAQISRIEVGMRGDQFERPAHLRDRVQIRLWHEDDLEFEVITENSAPSGDNRKLAEQFRRKMQQVVESIRAQQAERSGIDRGNPLDL